MKKDIEWEEFKLTQENGKELKLDDFQDFNSQTLYDFFVEAEKQAIKEGIETNTIILNPNFDKSKKFYLSFGYNVYEYPPMVLGKAVIMEDMLPDNVAFALTKTHVNTAEKELEKLRNLLKKYVKTDGFSLRFNKISFKKNSKDFEYIKEIIENED